jgi:hypothetical protein
MSQRIRLAAAAFGLGGLLVVAVPGAIGATAAETVENPVTDLSAQFNQRGGGGGGAARGGARAAPRAAPRPAARAAPRLGAQAAPRAVRQAPAARRIAPAVRPAARVAPRTVVVGGRRGAPLRIGGRRVVVVRGPRWVVWRGRRWGLVPIVALGALTVGSIAYAAYGYVPVDAPLCEGVTEDGCLLRWTEVPAADDPSILVPQCVQYCPR